MNYDLKVPIDKQYFDMIDSGIKLEEYRDIKKHWIQRICSSWIPKPIFRRFDTLTIINGYRKDSRRKTVKIGKIFIGEGKPEWGAVPGKKYFVIPILPK